MFQIYQIFADLLDLRFNVLDRWIFGVFELSFYMRQVGPFLFSTPDWCIKVSHEIEY